jgi:NAD(P)-dependent dehydrogenase (short-subunit alcohol dehydrogenase family)
VVGDVLRGGGKAVAVQADACKARGEAAVFVGAITKALANEIAGRKIRVTAIAPGRTETEGLAVMGIDGETAKNPGASLSTGRLGRPDDIAHVVVFLASDLTAWVRDERIAASGGQH